MFNNRLSAIIAGVSIVASTTQVIAQPVNAPKTQKEIVKEIQAVIEQPRTTPTKDDVARAQIEQRLKEIAVQRQQEEARKREEEAKTQASKNAQRLASKATPAQSFNVEQWRPIVSKYPWPVDEAMLTMARESGGNPRAISRTDDHGLFQIHGGYATHGEKIYDPEFNISLAYNNYYKTRGWRPWYAVRGILW